MSQLTYVDFCAIADSAILYLDDTLSVWDVDFGPQVLFGGVEVPEWVALSVSDEELESEDTRDTLEFRPSTFQGETAGEYVIRVVDHRDGVPRSLFLYTEVPARIADFIS